jgi:hypothetical protein
VLYFTVLLFLLLSKEMRSKRRRKGSEKGREKERKRATVNNPIVIYCLDQIAGKHICVILTHN